MDFYGFIVLLLMEWMDGKIGCFFLKISVDFLDFEIVLLFFVYFKEFVSNND